jgi:lycopene cyclase domain-containing protein
MSKYALVLFWAGIVPFILSLWPGLRFYRSPRALLFSIGLIVFFFGIWDVFAVWRGHWFFDKHSVWNYRVINLPLEEVLFFVVVPFCCIFTWEAMKFIAKKRP